MFHLVFVSFLLSFVVVHDCFFCVNVLLFLPCVFIIKFINHSVFRWALTQHSRWVLVVSSYSVGSMIDIYHVFHLCHYPFQKIIQRVHLSVIWHHMSTVQQGFWQQFRPRSSQESANCLANSLFHSCLTLGKWVCVRHVHQHSRLHLLQTMLWILWIYWVHTM